MFKLVIFLLCYFLITTVLMGITREYAYLKDKDVWWGQ